MAYLLGIDIGTSGTKTLICDEDGTVLATAMAEHPISCPKPGWSEQTPEDYTRYLVNSLRDTFKLPGTPIRLQLRGTKNPFVNEE